ncbi:MAG: tubulin-like doman-containing protein [Pirellulaceae bacterium]
MTATPTTAEPILGYLLREQIGAGGYGEVWTAEAPGGIQKAIKFIYGYHDENRAQRELKALNRIKELRHPFLLALDRIEVVNGQLVVITELAEMSLRDAFNKYLEQGHTGIPRDELLRFMRDTADALDFIGQVHSLQHLDIKPENLLLLSSHIKVGDFGLVKDIHDHTQSLMGGLTPTYAAPELFDGRPCKASDQYSLAIVYQEMLTGHRPFSGTTAAQLAAQHLHSRPKLSPLPRGDQSVISRALSKNPDSRFPSCMAMVEALSERRDHTSPIARSRPLSGGSSHSIKTDAKTHVGPPTPGSTLVMSESAAPLVRVAPKITRLPSLDIDLVNASFHPTIVIAIGQTATQAVRRFRKRLFDRLGERNEFPSIAWLCMDSDERDLAAATMSLGNDCLEFNETLGIPLRRPEEYRGDKQLHLAWLSRRWIYNIPRSLQTEGLRPLGRLAFIDHHEEIMQRLHKLLSHTCDQEQVERTAQLVSMAPDPTPRVYIVTSIAGGIGSGSVIDMGYTVRTAFEELALEHGSITGILLHSTGRFASDRDLTVANSYACLSELKHFAHSEGYPGDTSCGLPAFDKSTPPFDHTYLLDLGEDLRPDEFESAVDNISEYLFLNVATHCGAFFTKSRSEAPPDDVPYVRTFGLGFIEMMNQEALKLAAKQLASHVLLHWLGKEKATADTFLPEKFTALTFDRSGLTVPKLTSRVYEVAKEVLREPLAERFSRHLASVLPAESEIKNKQKMAAAATAIRETIRNAARFLLADDDAEAREPSHRKNLQRVQTALAREGMKLGQSLAYTISALIDTPVSRLWGTEATLTACRQRFTLLAEKTHEVRREVATSREAIESAIANSLTSKGPATTGAPGMLLNQYVQLANCDFALECMEHLLKAIQKELATWADTFHAMSASLLTTANDLREAFEKDAVGLEKSSEHSHRLVHSVCESLPLHMARAVARVEQIVQNELLSEVGGLATVIAEDSEYFERFVNTLLSACCVTLQDIVQETDCVAAIQGMNDLGPHDESHPDPRPKLAWFRQMLTRSNTSVWECGGSARLMLSGPEAALPAPDSEAIETLEQEPTNVPIRHDVLSACMEVGFVPIANFAANLLDNRPESAELVPRIHSRIDVNWNPLIGHI